MNRTCRLWSLLALAVVLLDMTLALSPRQGRRSRAIEPVTARAGGELFRRDWRRNDPLCPEGDGLGPVYNATSCIACHHQGGPGGSGGLKHNVTTFTVHSFDGKLLKEGVVHSFGWQRTESFKDVHPNLRELDELVPQLRDAPGSFVRFSGRIRPHGDFQVSQRNTPALFGARLIDAIPERVILAGARGQRVKWGTAPSGESEPIVMELSSSGRILPLPVGRVARLGNRRIGRFGWKAQMASLSDFVRAACASELGLGNPSQAQPPPLYAPNARARGLDLTERQCDQLTAFCASLPRPVERRPAGVTEADAVAGKKLFAKVGCADCHTPRLGPVDGIYSDLLLHEMGEGLAGGGSYGQQPQPQPGSKEQGPSPGEWRTPPLWGVADSAPYLHDGRAATLKEAIELHDGQGWRSARAFGELTPAEQARLIAFLETLRAP